MDKLDRLKQLEEIWYSDRDTISKDNDIGRLLQLIMGEVLEAQEAFQEKTDDEFLSEVADIGWFLFAIVKVMDSDLYEIMREKMAVNMARYKPSLFQEGSYDEARKIVKSNEREVLDDFKRVG